MLFKICMTVLVTMLVSFQMNTFASSKNSSRRLYLLIKNPDYCICQETIGRHLRNGADVTIRCWELVDENIVALHKEGMTLLEDPSFYEKQYTVDSFDAGTSTWELNRKFIELSFFLGVSLYTDRILADQPSLCLLKEACDHFSVHLSGTLLHYAAEKVRDPELFKLFLPIVAKKQLSSAQDGNA